MRLGNSTLFEAKRRGMGIKTASLTTGKESTERPGSRQHRGNIGNRYSMKKLAEVAEFGEPALLGRGGRRFKSGHPDHPRPCWCWDVSRPALSGDYRRGVLLATKGNRQPRSFTGRSGGESFAATRAPLTPLVPCGCSTRDHQGEYHNHRRHGDSSVPWLEDRDQRIQEHAPSR